MLKNAELAKGKEEKVNQVWWKTSKMLKGIFCKARIDDQFSLITYTYILSREFWEQKSPHLKVVKFEKW